MQILCEQIDLVDSALLEMADNGIHVHCSRPEEAAISHPLIHFYDRFDDVAFENGEFGQFIGQFNAAVVLYNYRKCHARFASTFPTRMLVALCGCIPIFVKKGLLLSCKELVERNGIGRTYENGAELYQMLMNCDLMWELRNNAKRNEIKFASDSANNKSLLSTFFQGL